MAIALALSGLPTELTVRHRLDHRMHNRGGELEIQFWHRARSPRLPIVRDGQIQIVRWGNARGHSRFLPATGWTWQESIEAGMWQQLDSETVDIPATLGCERGIWYTIHQGIRGLLVPDENGTAVVYMICEPASHYYRIMTRSDRMPVFIDQRI
jgi:hypothetical protein